MTFLALVCIYILTCSEEAIDVHSFLLSISPYASHGLEKEKMQGRMTHSTIWWKYMYMSVI